MCYAPPLPVYFLGMNREGRAPLVSPVDIVGLLLDPFWNPPTGWALRCKERVPDLGENLPPRGPERHGVQWHSLQ